jgi:hypothetical protein
LNFLIIFIFQLGLKIKLDDVAVFLSPNPITSDLVKALYPFYSLNFVMVGNYLAFSSILRACGYG